MSSIFEIYAENGSVQASGDGGIGFGLSATGNLVLSNDGQAHPQPMVVGQVQRTGVNPIFAFKANGPICVERVNVSGSTFNWYLRAQSFNAIGVQYWIFDTSAAAIKDATMADLEVALYDEFGVKTFDATTSMMRVANSTVHEIDGSIPFGRFINLEQTSEIIVPSGRVYAIVQSTPSFAFTTYDTGGYSNSQNKPDTVIIDDGSEPPGGFYRWRQQALQSYQATGGYIGPNTIECGLTRFEYFDLGWQPQSSDPFMQVHGRARHTIIDVTNFVSAGQVDPTTVTGNVNATVRSVSMGGAETISQSTTPIVTCSPSGGTAPYSYLWQYVSGNDQIMPAGGSQASTFNTTTYNQPAGSTREAIYRCRITDANGYVGYSPDITFSHTAQTYQNDYVPDMLALSPLTLVSNENQAATSDVADIVGFNKPITIRVERYNYGGFIHAAAVYVYTAPLGTTNWTYHGSFDPRGTGLSYLDVNISGPCRLHYVIDSVSTSGRRDYYFDMVVWNLSNPGGAAQISTGKRITVTVDADNNYNVPDWTPDPISIPNLTGYVSNDYQLSTDGRFFQITGINQTTYIRFTRDSLVQSGGIFTRRLYIYKSTTGSGGPWTQYQLGAAAGAYTDIPMNNGDWIYVQGYIDTSAGRGSASWRNYVHFHDGTTILGHLATFDISGTVDNDDNYYAADYTPNAVDWGDVSSATNDTQAAIGNGYQMLTGFNQPIQVRHTVVSGTSHNFSGGGVQMYIDGVYQGECSLGIGATFAKAGVYAGQQMSFVGYGNTTSGRRDGSILVHVTNDTTGEFIDAFWFHLTADADNNYNVTVDYSPNPISFASLSGSSFDNFNTSVTATSQTYYLTGFQAAFTSRIYLGYWSHFFDQNSGSGGGPIMVGDGPTSGSLNLDIYRNGAYVGSLTHYLYGSYSGAEQYTWRDDITFSPNDSVQFILTMTGDVSDWNAGLSASTQGGIYFDNLTVPGERIGSFTHTMSVNKQAQGGGVWG